MKVFKLLHQLIRRRFVWLSSKTKFPVVVIELESAFTVSSLLPSLSQFFLLSIRGNQLFINFHIFWVLMARSRLLLSKRISLRGLYILAISQTIGAKLIISIIDNNSWGNLFKYSDLRIISLQNGLRVANEYGLMSEQDIYIGFSKKKPKDLKTRTYLGLGSLSIASLKPTDRPERSDKDETVVFVSHFRSHRCGDSAHDSQIFLAKWAANYAKERGLLFKIALNARETAQSNEEKEYFQSAGIHFQYSEQSHPNVSIEDVSNAALVVGGWSTLLVESLALGIPTLICYQLLLDKLYPKAGNESLGFELVDRDFLLPATANFVTFCDFADHLFHLSQESLAKKVIQHRIDVCAVPIGDEYSKTLEKIVLKILKNKKLDK
ncbi:hypothetical protein ACYVU7_03950 [Arenicellales bacterium IMCC56312]